MEPAFFAVIFPLELTVATEDLELFHVTVPLPPERAAPRERVSHFPGRIFDADLPLDIAAAVLQMLSAICRNCSRSSRANRNDRCNFSENLHSVTLLKNISPLVSNIPNRDIYIIPLWYNNFKG